MRKEQNDRIVWSIDDLCRAYGLKLSYYYNNADFFEPARLRIGGKYLKPTKFDPDKVRELMEVGSYVPTDSLKIRQNQESIQSFSSSKNRRKLWQK